MIAVTLFVMTYRGYATLLEVVNEVSSLNVVQVVTARDSALQKDYCDEIKTFCVNQGIPVYERGDQYKISTDWVIAVAWRWMIDPFNFKLIVFHDSLLPKYRGFAPVVNALIKGDTEIGVTAVCVKEEAVGYDTGEIVAQKKIGIKYPIKVRSVLDMVAVLYQELVHEVASNLVSGLATVLQQEDQATYSVWRDGEDYRIDWSQSSEEICRFVDAVGYPYLGATTNIGDLLVRVEDCEVYPDVKVELREKHVGKVLFMVDDRPVVICGKGLLRLKSAFYDIGGYSIFPLKKFRTRFR